LTLQPPPAKVVFNVILAGGGYLCIIKDIWKVQSKKRRLHSAPSWSRARGKSAKLPYCRNHLYAQPETDWKMFWGAYIKTYIERDVRDSAQVGDEIKFLQFMTAIAACTGQLLNLASVARDIGISPPTADRWLSILVASGIVHLLRPYHNNLTKRTVKTPKVYFLDTGLAAYLTRWNTPDVLQSGAMAGVLFETFVVSEIIKSYYNAGVLDLPLYFYRDKDMVEIDLLIENGGTLYPIEIKKHANPDKNDVTAFRAIEKIPNIKRGSGGVVCMYDNLMTLKDNDRIIPVKYL
jgi:predicted AAA+ superfamily ATPase